MCNEGLLPGVVHLLWQEQIKISACASVFYILGFREVYTFRACFGALHVLFCADVAFERGDFKSHSTVLEHSECSGLILGHCD